MSPVRNALVVVSAAALFAGCSADREPPAAVTVPRMNTTTTAPDGTIAPPPPDVEPLEPSWVLQIGGEGDEELVALTSIAAELVAVGSVAEPGAAPDAFVARASTGGELLSSGPSGTEATDRATAVASNETDLLVCGVTDGEFGGPSGGATDVWCAPLTDGTELDAVRQLGGPDNERITGLAMDRGLDLAYASGSASAPLPGAERNSDAALGGEDALALQIGLGGLPEWARQFGTNGEDSANGVTMSENGDGVFVGATDGSLDGPSFGGRDAWISRFDRSGTQRWTTQVGSEGNEVFADVTPLGEARRGTERYVAVGATDGDFGAGLTAPSGGLDVAVASFGPAGDLQWATRFGTETDDVATAVVVDGDTLYVTGTTGGELGELAEDLGPGGGTDGFLAAVDSNSGDVLWVLRFGSDDDDVVNAAAVTRDGLLVVAGTTSGSIGDNESGGGTDGFLIAFPLDATAGTAARQV